MTTEGAQRDLDDLDKRLEIEEAMTSTNKYDIKIYKKDGREGPTVRGLTYGQQYTLLIALEEHNIKHLVKEVRKT